MRVLMIEDEPDTAEALSWDLTAQGYVVDLAGTGVDGLWKATENDCLSIDRFSTGAGSGDRQYMISAGGTPEALNAGRYPAQAAGFRRPG
jgi:CheY-like chemotaxis protein